MISVVAALVTLALVAPACSATPRIQSVAAVPSGLSSSHPGGSTAATDPPASQGSGSGAIAVAQIPEPSCDPARASALGVELMDDGGMITFIAPPETVEQLMPDARREPVPDVWLDRGFSCVELLPDDGSEISCGRKTGWIEVRLRPLVLRFTIYPAGIDGPTHTIAPVHVFNPCPESTSTPSYAANPATWIDARTTTWDPELAERTLGEIATWVAAIDQDLDGVTCTGLAVAGERLVAYHQALVEFLEIETLWQPVADSWVPDPERFAELQVTGDRVRGIVLPTAIPLLGEPAGEMLTATGLRSLLWLGFPEPDSFEATGSRFAADAYRAEAGRRTAGATPGRYQADMVDILLQTACDADERAAADQAAVEIEHPALGPLCSDLARAYAARVALRAEVAKDPTARHPDLRSLIEPLDHLHSTIHEHWEIGGNPYFHNGAAWSLYAAESALILQVDNGVPMNRTEITAEEERAAPMHEFAKEHCPEITEGVDLASVLDLVMDPDVDAVSGAQAEFCRSARAMLQARDDLVDLIDPSGQATPWTPDSAALYQTVLTEVDFLIEQIEQNELLVNPTGEHIFTAMFTRIATGLTAIRTAHFGPVIVPMRRYETTTFDGPPGSDLGFMAVCDTSEAELAGYVIDFAALPGPMYEGSGFEPDTDINDLCAFRDNALLARSGHRAALQAVLAGDEDAATTARAYYDRFEELGRGLGDAVYTVLGDDQELRIMSSGFANSEWTLHAAFLDEIEDWARDGFSDALEQRDLLLGLLIDHCGVPASPLTDVSQDLQLFEQLSALHELPPVLPIERLCAELEVVYRARADFRALLAVDDDYRAERHIETMADVYQDLRSSVDEFPDGFDLDWLDAMRRNEGQLFRRLERDTPLEVAVIEERLPRVALLDEYIAAHCPNVTEGLDATPALEVFGAPDDDTIAAARAEFCAAVDELFNARLAFRELVPTEPSAATPEVEAAFDRVLVASETTQAIFDAQELLINHEGLDFGGYLIDSIGDEESVIRHAFFGPAVLPRVERDSTGDAAGTQLAAFASKVCTEPSLAVTTPVSPAEELGGPTLPSVSSVDDSEVGALYCPYLETLRQSQEATLDAFERAADGDPAAARAALALEELQNRYRYSLDEAAEARFPEAEATTAGTGLTFVPFALSFTLRTALQGETESSDRRRVERFVETNYQLHPTALAACPDLPADLRDVSFSQLLDLYDRLLDL